MKAQSKYFLNMVEVDSHHLTAKAGNKEHLCITFENQQSAFNITFNLPYIYPSGRNLFK